MKESGTAHWSVPNNGATNSSGFTGLPGGCFVRAGNGVFTNKVDYGYWWTSSEIYSSSAWYRWLFSNDTSVMIINTLKETGYSIRCIKDN